MALVPKDIAALHHAAGVNRQLATMFLVPKEIAALLRISRKTVYGLLRRGEIRSFKLGDKPGSEIRCRKADVLEYISRRMAIERDWRQAPSPKGKSTACNQKKEESNGANLA